MSSEDEGKPWWDSDSDEGDLPPGFPERPDIKKVRKLQKQLTFDRNLCQKRRAKNSFVLRNKTGKQVRDIGSYTMIPMMMVAGPLLGFGLGYLAQRQWGGDPWPGIVGLFLGLAAAFRQIFILLTKKESSRK